MDSIPESWPPDEAALNQPVVPLFPLPNVWLFPYLLLPLNVFEERYRQMIEDCLDGPGRIVLGTIQEGHEESMAGAPPVYPIAGLGEIGRHVRLPDGRFHVWLMGLQRVLLREVPSDRLYRRVAVEPAPEVSVPEAEEGPLRSKLLEALEQRTDKKELSPQVPASHLTDLLIMSMPLPHDVRNTLYGELDTAKRAAKALNEHAARPLEREGDGPQSGFLAPEGD